MDSDTVKTTGATFVAVHQSGRELVLETDTPPEELEDVIFSVLTNRPECPIFRFKQSKAKYPMLINLNHFSYCEVNARGERSTDSGILIPQVATALQKLRRPNG